MNFDRRASGWRVPPLHGPARRGAARARRARASTSCSSASASPTPATSGCRNTRAACCSASAWRRRSMRDPEFLFLDEPTSGLDPNGVFLVRDLIAEQKQRGAAVLLNSHQLAEVEKVCDRVLFLQRRRRSRATKTLRDIANDHIAVTLLAGSFDAAARRARSAGVRRRTNVVIASSRPRERSRSSCRASSQPARASSTSAGARPISKSSSEVRRECRRDRRDGAAAFRAHRLHRRAAGADRHRRRRWPRIGAPSQAPFEMIGLFTLIAGCQLIGPEFSKGTLQLILSKPIRRSRVSALARDRRGAGDLGGDRRGVRQRRRRPPDRRNDDHLAQGAARRCPSRRSKAVLICCAAGVPRQLLALVCERRASTSACRFCCR